MDASEKPPALPEPGEAEVPPTSEVPSADAVLLHHERDALRVIVAAVAAQQAALTDEESRIEQRAREVANQEMQLVRHLDDRQRELDEQAEQLKQERSAFEADRGAAQEALADGLRQREALHRDRQEFARQQERAKQLRRRLWKRYQQRARDKDAELARRQSDLAAREQQLERDRERVRAFQERLNGELEIGRRTLQEDARGLALDQQRYHEAVEAERREQAARRAQLDAEQRHWREEYARLKRECEGLERRVAHQREQVTSPPREVIHLVAPTPLAEPLPEWPERLRELAGMLADQRNHLAEQWQHLLHVQEQWEEHRLAALTDLELAGERLDRRDRDLAAAEEHFRDLDARRGELDGRQARLVVERAAWEARRQETEARLDEQQRYLQRQRDRLDEAIAEQERRAQAELTMWADAYARQEEARRQAAELWRECDEARAELADEQRRVAAEALALERLRYEVAHQTTDAGKAEARLEKLSDRELARLDGEAREVDREREKLSRLHDELQEESQRLDRLEADLLARQERWSRQVIEWDRRRVETEAEDARGQQEARRLRARQAIDERQLRQLREEIERLARGLIDAASDPPARNAA